MPFSNRISNAFPTCCKTLAVWLKEWYHKKALCYHKAYYLITAHITGNPTTRWFREKEQIEPSDEFQLLSDGELRKLVFAEVFPDDTGTYTCLISNPAGEDKSRCVLTVQGERNSLMISVSRKTIVLQKQM